MDVDGDLQQWSVDSDGIYYPVHVEKRKRWRKKLQSCLSNPQTAKQFLIDGDA